MAIIRASTNHCVIMRMSKNGRPTYGGSHRVNPRKLQELLVPQRLFNVIQKIDIFLPGCSRKNGEMKNNLGTNHNTKLRPESLIGPLKKD